MSGRLQTVKELINPGWVRHPSVPPLEAGLRPNDKLDGGEVLLRDFEADDLASWDGTVALSRGREVHLLEGRSVRLLATFEGEVSALAASAQGLLVAVRGTGIVAVDRDGTPRLLHGDSRLAGCVTSMCSLGGEEVAVTIGSLHHDSDQWRHALVARDRSGCVLLVGRCGSHVLADGLGWPSGVAPAEAGTVLVSVANEFRLDVIPVTGGARRAMIRNLPAYPGRISSSGSDWLVSFPYVRNRLSEMLLDDKAFLQDMIATVEPQDWLVPALRIENPYRSALQLGQLRVLGVLKPWAPARSYGLVGVLEPSGRFRASLHSRVHGTQHGVTAALPVGPDTLIAVRGSRSVVLVQEEL